jgi:hypothetical protein
MVKTYWGSGDTAPCFLILALDGGEWCKYKIVKDVEVRNLACFKVLCQHLPGGTDKNLSG